MKLSTLITNLVTSLHSHEDILVKHGYEVHPIVVPLFSIYFEADKYFLDTKTQKGTKGWPLNKSKHEAMVALKDIKDIINTAAQIAEKLQDNAFLQKIADLDFNSTLQVIIRHDVNYSEYSVRFCGKTIHEQNVLKNTPKLEIGNVLEKRLAILDSVDGDTGNQRWFLRNGMGIRGESGDVFADNEKNAKAIHYIMSDEQFLEKITPGEDYIQDLQNIPVQVYKLQP